MRRALITLALLTPAIARAIVGGGETQPPPALARLSDCHGTLIAPSFLLTAAHCLPLDAESVSIGSDEVNTVQGCVAHPGYPREQGSDVAVCRLQRPATAPSAGLDCEQPNTLTLIGAGLHAADAPRDDVVRSVRVQARRFQAAGRELVVGDADHGACRGDSGSGAYDERGQLCGVVSRRGAHADGSLGDDCAGTTVLTWLAPHRAWIERSVQPSTSFDAAWLLVLGLLLRRSD